MANITISIGEENFELLRKNNSYYIDKTKFIIELLQNKFKVNLIIRPRRFGKTLTMSMLKNFFDIRKNSIEIFEGLQILNHKGLCSQWMNQWPVLFLSFKDITSNQFQKSYDQLVYNIASLCIEHTYLAKSDKVDQSDKNCFIRLKNKIATETEVRNSLFMLTRMMYMHYGKPVILLIDEYDVPLSKASEYEYYQEMLDIIRSLMNTSFKTNDFLQFAVVTGCLRIARESIFTGTNNFVVNSIYDGDYMDTFGFTESEVKKILEDTNLDKHINDMKKWYDGYCFGKYEMYCPWDIINYTVALRKDSKKRPKNYWKDTSHNDIIKKFIGYKNIDVNKKFELLLSDKEIKVSLNEDLNYNFEQASEKDFWNILYLTGYLTTTGNNKNLNLGEVYLKIPNEEIKTIFHDTIVEWFQETAQGWNKKALFIAVWNKDAEKITIELTKLLRKTISYYDYKEDFYHAFLAGIFAGGGYKVESNKEHGEGRSDIVIKDYGEGKVAIFEVKHSSIKENLYKDCNEALQQISNRQYAEEFIEDYEQVICFGISFYKKQCKVILLH